MLLTFIWAFVPYKGIAQKMYTVSGLIRDASTGELLIGASVKISALNQYGTISNQYGFYSLTANPADYVLQISYIGYQTKLMPVHLQKSLSLNIDLFSNNQLQEVTVKSISAQTGILTNPLMGVNKLAMAEVSLVPVIFGENDVVKAIEMLPGVKTTGDANTGFYVRGGGADENLILLDGATVYNASHLFGFFSTFNSDAIKDISLYKGGMPAQYGGRLSSVLDVTMENGNNKQFGLEGGIGLIASRIKIEGPIFKNKSSFMVSARRTYADVFLKLSSDSSLRSSSLYFYDLNAKANYQVNDHNCIYLSVYLGKDNISISDNFATNWGNSTATLRFNHIFNSRLFSNTSLIYSKYNYNVGNQELTNQFNIYSKIQDVNLKLDFEYYFKQGNKFFFGLAGVHHTIVPGDITSPLNSSINPLSIENRYGDEFTAYVSDEWQVTKKLTLNYGIRFNVFLATGAGTFDNYDSSGLINSSSTYSSWQIVKAYFNAEPRLSANYNINSQSSFKVSYNINSQNIHLLSNSTNSLPTDLYVMSSNNIKPGIANQASLGYFRNSTNNLYEFSAETYYKWLGNEIDYRNDAQLVANQNVESQLLYGTGRAYGIELFLKKKYGSFNGWIGYTLSRTERKFTGINNGAYFPARQDRTHDLSVVGLYKMTGRLSFSSVFIYGTGNAVTYPAGKYKIGGITTYYYADRNGSRLPPNNRLDIGATLEGKSHARYHSSWNFSIYNVYDRKNPYSVIFQDSNTNPPHSEAVETSLFGIIPSITWNFNFK